MTVYINWKPEREVETVDEFETYKEARTACAEYNCAFGGGCYLSSRCTKEWREDARAGRSENTI